MNATAVSVDIAWLLGDDAESIVRRRRAEVIKQLHDADAAAMAELDANDSLHELVRRALQALRESPYRSTLVLRGYVGRSATITKCEQALRAFYALESIGGVR